MPQRQTWIQDGEKAGIYGDPFLKDKRTLQQFAWPDLLNFPGYAPETLTRLDAATGNLFSEPLQKPCRV